MNGWRPHIESALCLDLPRLRKQGFFRPGCTVTTQLQWGNRGSIGFRAEVRESDGTMTLNYSVADRDGARRPIECIIRLTTVANHYGGRSWFMQCPCTFRRARKLYKWPGLPQFMHRDAVRPKPTYASQRVSGIERVNAQRWAIRRRLGDEVSDLFGEPFKPKWMRWHTFDKFAERDAELDERDTVLFWRFIGRFSLLK